MLGFCVRFVAAQLFELGFFCFSGRVFENGVCSLVLLLGVVNLETVYDKNDRKTIGAITRKSKRAEMTKKFWPQYAPLYPREREAYLIGRKL